MAKQVSVAEFAALAVRTVGKNSNLSWAEVEAVAHRNDVRIPTVIRNGGVGKGKNKVFMTTLVDTATVSTPSVPSASPVLKGTTPEAQLFVNVFAKDSNGRFRRPGADEVQAAIRAARSSEIDEDVKDPSKIFDHMSALTRLVANGNSKSLFIYGGPGLGKTYVVIETLEKHGLVKGKDFVIVKGKVTPSALYTTLYRHRDGKLIVFDDSDSVFGNPDAVNILKAGLDSYDKRTISWLSTRTINVSLFSDEEKKEFEAKVDRELAEDPESSKIKFPSEFDFDGRIVFISNLTPDKIDEAVFSRSFKIDMSLSPNQIFKRMESLLETLGDNGVAIEDKRKILDYLKDRYTDGKLQQPNMRTFVIATQIFKSGLANWTELLDYA